MNDKTNIAREGDEQHNTIGRRRRIYVRVTENEFARIRSRARKAGMSISAFARTRLLGDAEARPTLDIDIAELRKAFADLKHAGSNLNQCARALNTFGADGDSAANTEPRGAPRLRSSGQHLRAYLRSAQLGEKWKSSSPPSSALWHSGHLAALHLPGQWITF